MRNAGYVWKCLVIAISVGFRSLGMHVVVKERNSDDDAILFGGIFRRISHYGILKGEPLGVSPR